MVHVSMINYSFRHSTHTKSRLNFETLKLEALVDMELRNVFCSLSYFKTWSLRWSETKNLKISNPDNIFFLYLIMIKPSTLKQLENIHQKLKLTFS